MDEALAALRAAVEDEGPRPDLHREVMARHRAEWPTLWTAIDRLLGSDQDWFGEWDGADVD